MSKGFEFADHLIGKMFDGNHHCNFCEDEKCKD